MTEHHPVEVPLPEYIREAAREAARTVIDEHVKSCAIAREIHDLKINHRQIVVEVDKLKLKFATLIGLMAGAGAAGGGVGGLVVSLLGG